MAWPIESKLGRGLFPVGQLLFIARAIDERARNHMQAPSRAVDIVMGFQGLERGDSSDGLANIMTRLDDELKTCLTPTNARFIDPDFSGWLIEPRPGASPPVFDNAPGAIIDSLERCTELLGEELVTVESLRMGATAAAWASQRYRMLNLLYRRRYSVLSPAFGLQAVNGESRGGSASGYSTEGATALSTYNAAVANANSGVTGYSGAVSYSSWNDYVQYIIYSSTVSTSRWNYGVINNNVINIDGDYKLVVYARVPNATHQEFNGRGVYSEGFTALPVDGIDTTGGTPMFTPAFGSLDFIPFSASPDGNTKGAGYEVLAQYIDMKHDYEYLDLE